MFEKQALMIGYLSFSKEEGTWKKEIM